MGSAHMDNVRRYWNNGFGYPALTSHWSRDRFLAILQALNCHIVDDAAGAVSGGEDDPDEAVADGDDADETAVDEHDDDDVAIDEEDTEDNAARAAAEAEAEAAAFGASAPSATAGSDSSASAGANVSRSIDVAVAVTVVAQPPPKAASYDPAGRFANVHWLMDHFNGRCAELMTPGQHICIDESMIKYRGKHKSVMLMPNKPIKRGFKAFVVGTGSGYILHSVLCAGKTDTTTETKSTVEVVKQLVGPYVGQWRRLTIDNYYTFIPLFQQLYAYKVLATGTIRPNRQQFPEHHRFKGTKALRQASTEKGGVHRSQHPDLPALNIVSYFRTHFKDDQRHYITTAHSNPHHMTAKASHHRRKSAAAKKAAKAMPPAPPPPEPDAESAAAVPASSRLDFKHSAVSSTSASASASGSAALPPTKTVGKAANVADAAAVSQKDKEVVHTLPQVAFDYNAKMSVIDAANRWAAMYSPWRRSPRWWLSIILHLFHVAVSNSFVLYRLHQPTDSKWLSFSKFTDALAVDLLELIPPRNPPYLILSKPHTFAQQINPETKKSIARRCSVCCSRSVTKQTNARGQPVRSETQSGGQSTYFCVECSRSCMRFVYVCNKIDCRARHIASPPLPPLISTPPVSNGK